MSEHTRVYVDMVGDLFHAGHVELLREARRFGDRLVVGVLSDDVVAEYKRRPVATLEERVTVVRACRYVDEVIPGAPDVVTLGFLREHDLSLVVHGDDLTEEAIATVYAEVAEAGLLRLVPRTTGISTTELIRRVLDDGRTGPGHGPDHRHEDAAPGP
jgi:cytidyltransferase-like protein